MHPWFSPIFSLFLGFAIWLAPVPEGLTPEAWQLFAIFAATMSSMDSGLNRNAGIIVKNFYNSVLRPQASEKELLTASKLTTLALGIGIISAAVLFSQLESLGLFDLMLQFSALIALPLNIPMLWGMVFKKTPDWSGWATAIFGLCVAW